MKKARWPGEWKVACMSCGFWYPSSEIRKRWDGLLVCQKDYETRHPQTLIKVREETAVPSFVNKDASPDAFIQYCALEDQSCYTGLAVSGCASAGNQKYTSAFLWELHTNGHTVK